jgi:antitoxin PrlF
MTLVHLHKKGQMTLPQSVRARFDLEDGDLLEVDVQDDAIILRPKKLIDASQAYFWSESWQAGERQASADIAEGRTRQFADAQTAIAYLQSEATQRQDD